MKQVHAPRVRGRDARRLPSGRARARPTSAVERLERRLLLANVPQGFTDATVVSNLSSPTAMAIAPDGRVFIAHQNGVVRVVKDGQLLPTPFATLNANSSGERGLLGITFDPNFEQNQYVYVYYTVNTTVRHNRVSRLLAAGDVAAGAEVPLIDFPDIQGAIWHMGGALHFGPDDKLYVAVGDHQQVQTAQPLTSVFGKILRFNSDGTIPEDNPFYNQTTGLARSIWARGLRNPFTFAFQPGTGRMFLNDVGQEAYEEINVGLPGGNYGWPSSEGPNNTGGFNAPFYYYSHAQGCSIAGGAFYNPPQGQFPAEFVGKYFFGDYCGGWIRTIDPNNAAAVTTFATGINGMVDIDVAPDGSLYYLSRGQDLNAGMIGRIRHELAGMPMIAEQPQPATATVGEPVTFSVTANGAPPINYQWQRRNVGAVEFANIPGATASSYTIGAVAAADHDARFRVVVSNGVGQVTSAEAVLTITANQRPAATITAPAAGSVYRAGDTIAFAGTATDPEDGPLAGSAFTWQVDFYTNNLARPFLPATSGSASGSFDVPTTGIYKRPDVFFRIILTVADSGGRTHTVTRDVLPVTSTVTLDTNVPGLQLTLDGLPMETPFSFGSVVNFEREIGAPSPQLVNGVSYEFVGWSDGGAQTHVISTPEDDTTFLATYRPLSFVHASDLPFVAAANGWGPVERDMSNGETAAADGRPITLNGVIYPKGLGVHAQADVSFDLSGRYRRFLADVGVDDEVGSQGSVVFQVYRDSVLSYDSGTLLGSSPAASIDLDVSGVQVLRLVVTDAGDGKHYDHADWAGARFIGRALEVVQAGFAYETSPHRLAFQFDADVAPTLTLEDLIVRNLATGVEVPREAMQLAYDPATETATVTFPGLVGQVLAEGDYRATLRADGIVSTTGNALVQDYVFDFFHLPGDANHDGIVNLTDFNILAANFGQSGRDFTQGDFNYDAVVNLVDFNLLAARFGGGSTRFSSLSQIAWDSDDVEDELVI